MDSKGMARADWEYVNIPKEMYDLIKSATDDPTFRARGFTSPKELIVSILRKWIDENNPK